MKKVYSSKLRHVGRTHKVNIASLHDTVSIDSVIIEYVQTHLQAADIFTKSLEPQKWGNALTLFGMQQVDVT